MAVFREKQKTAADSARHCLAMLAPFAPSCEAHAAGERAFYTFMAGVYREMAEDPERFAVSDAAYRAYMEKAALRPKTAEKAHAADSRESTLRNGFQQAVEFYARFFWELGLAAEPETEGGALVLPKSAYNTAVEKLSRIHDRKRNPERYALLGALGWRFAEAGETVRVSFAPDPPAVQGILCLCKAPENKYKWMNCLRLDFKNAAAGKAPGVEDVLPTLS